MVLRKHGIFVSVLLILFLTFSVTVCTSAQTATFSGGNGTATDPFLISTVTQLDLVRNYPDAHFQLSCDLTFTDDDYDDPKKGWIPIGTFSGVFDGNGYVIKNLKVARTGSEVSVLLGGLFAVNKGVVRNLKLVDCTISVTKKLIPSTDLLSYSGGIAGRNLGTVSDCSVSGSVSAGSRGRAGGIVGANEGIIRNCSNSATVTADGASSYAGGICGDGGNISYCSNSGEIYSSNLYAGGISGSGENIFFCYNIGTVQADYATGGIVGRGGNITNCYNTGSVVRLDISGSGAVQDRSYTGGIVGESIGPVTDCYNTGTVSASSQSTSHSSGGIVGWNTVTVQNCYNVGYVSGGRSGAIIGLNEGMVLNCYYLDSLTSGSGYGPDPVVRCTVGQLSRKDTYSGFDFNGAWHHDPYYRYAYPQLNGLLSATVVGMEVKSQPENNGLAIGGSINLTGATVLITYSDGYTTLRPITEEMLSPLDSNQTGLQQLTVSYGGITAKQKLVFSVGCPEHSFGGWTVTVPATCTSPGTQEKTCTFCGISQSGTLPLAAHNYGAWGTVKAASCTSTGLRERMCSGCSLKQQEKLEMMKHSYTVVEKTNPTCTQPGAETLKCSVCGDCQKTELSAFGHDFNAPVTVKEPTDAEAGLQERKCNRCSAVIQERIPVLSSDTDAATTDSSEPESDKTDFATDSIADSTTDLTTDWTTASEYSQNPDSSLLNPPVTDGITESTGTIILQVPSFSDVSGDQDSSDGSNSIWFVLGLIAILTSGGIVVIVLCLYFGTFRREDDADEDDGESDPEMDADGPEEIFGDE